MGSEKITQLKALCRTMHVLYGKCPLNVGVRFAVGYSDQHKIWMVFLGGKPSLTMENEFTKKIMDYCNIRTFVSPRRVGETTENEYLYIIEVLGENKIRGEIKYGRIKL